MRKRRLVVATTAAFVAVAIGLGAFFLLNGGGPGDGTVTGTIELTDPGANAPKLISGQVQVEAVTTGRIARYVTIRTISVGASGRFKQSLPSGDYYLEGSGDFDLGGVSQQASTGVEVTVRTGRTTDVPFQINVTGLG